MAKRVREVLAEMGIALPNIDEQSDMVAKYLPMAKMLYHNPDNETAHKIVERLAQKIERL